MTTVNVAKVLIKRYPIARCYCTKQPQDYINPPTKYWRYMVNKFNSFVDHYEKKLENKAPNTFKVYKTIKCVRYIASDTKDYLSVSAELWAGRELHTLTRKELEVYQELPRDMVKIVTLLFLAAIPFIGNLFVIVGYLYPRVLFTHHLWNDQQKEEFNQYFLTYRLAQYRHILAAVDKASKKQLTEVDQEQVKNILHKLKNASHPSKDELLGVKSCFENVPYSIDSLPTFYLRHVAKANKMSMRRSSLQQEGLLLLHMDRAMVREGIDSLTDADLCHVCLKRGLNPYGVSREERIEFLKLWTDISAELDENSISLLLHCPALLTYNKKTNIQLMKGKKYGWKYHKHS